MDLAYFCQLGGPANYPGDNVGKLGWQGPCHLQACLNPVPFTNTRIMSLKILKSQSNSFPHSCVFNCVWQEKDPKSFLSCVCFHGNELNCSPEPSLQGFMVLKIQWALIWPRLLLCYKMCNSYCSKTYLKFSLFNVGVGEK